MTDMILTKIVLNNFRRFVVVEVDFHSGVTGLLGANGSGKTTIADGIGFALIRLTTCPDKDRQGRYEEK